MVNRDEFFQCLVVFSIFISPKRPRTGHKKRYLLMISRRGGKS